MNLKYRLASYSALIFTFIIFTTSTIIYAIFYNWMEHEKLETLENKALLAAIYYLERDEQSEQEKNFTSSKLKESISKSNIALYNINNVLERGEMSNLNDIDVTFLNKVRKEKTKNLITQNFFYSAIFYEDNEGDFVVIARENKTDFNANSNLLLEVLFLVSIIGMVVIFFSSLFLAKWALKPLTNIIEQIKSKNNQNLTEPIDTKDKYTEITDLVTTYNIFTNRIDQTLQVQKNFIDYVSHELRTPITALLGTLEITNTKHRTPTEYRETFNILKQYVIDLEHTIDNMMLLSGAKTTFEFKKIRIDEIIWEVVEQAIMYHNATIEVVINVTNPDVLVINANNQLLSLAINNIVNNAIKYSDHDLVIVKLEETKNMGILSIIDKGIGIPENDLLKIKQNFYRGKNTQNTEGKGIGLSIANIILKLHNIELIIKKNNPKGTCVELQFNKKTA